MSLLAAIPVAVVSVFRAVPVEWPLLVVQLLSFTPWLTLP
ncbi:MAG TPA: endonuclease/exonuclease/phosphatase family protein, partial [Arthrobacter sp.]